MVKRCKDELILIATLIVCALFGGYFGGKLAQMRYPKPSATYESAPTFGRLPSELAPTVIVIYVKEFPPEQAKSATNRADSALNAIQERVNII